MPAGARGAPETVPALLLARAEQAAERLFVHCGGRTVTCAEAVVRAGRLAGGLRELSIGRGSRVAVMLPNNLEFLDAWFALAFLGAVLVPVNVHQVGSGLAHVLHHSGAEALIGTGAALASAAAVGAETPAIRHRILAGPAASEIAAVPWPEVAEAPPATPVAVGRDDLMAILYTSGTTGPAKGVMLGHFTYAHTGAMYARHLGLVPEDRLHTVLPLFHVNAQQLTVMGALQAGVPVYLDSHFSASRFWPDIRRYGATVTNFLGVMISILCKMPEQADDGDNPLRIAVSAACPRELWATFERRFRVVLAEGYGLTETATLATWNPLGASRIGSVGPAVPYAEVQVVDASDVPVPPGEMGEICVRFRDPSTFMQGYYRQPDQTAAAMRGGWFHTGDRGYMDAGGYVYFVDRLKDCIRRRGENISSFDIEKTLLAHPQVLKCAAIGVPAELGEEDVKVVLVPRPGAQLTPEEIIDFCLESMAYYMVPRYVDIRDSLPMTATERIQKFELRAEGAGQAWDRVQAGYRLERPRPPKGGNQRG